MLLGVGQGLDVLAGRLDVGEERDVEVDGEAAYEVVVLEFALEVVLRDVDDEIELAPVHHGEDVGLGFLEGPVERGDFDPVFL